LPTKPPTVTLFAMQALIVSVNFITAARFAPGHRNGSA
jgi:hypothetical protein